MIKKLFWTLVFLSFVTLSAAGSALYWLIVVDPGDEIREQNINAILGKESPVFYNDGKTRLGVFFDQAHRQYVPYDEIPVNFINALVASEDNRFFSHFGFDILGISRAMIKNVQSRRIVQGGSTLTQQTAKNLFKRKSRTVQAKLKELLFALRLEYHYSKEKIFEFYANQFYVSGNGHGLGVAARYYFNKKPEELNLLQCAYIAGSVKRPNYYNPFIKKSDEGAKKALKRGRTRLNYVLNQMLALGMISEYQYGIAKFSDIGFEKGQVGFSLDYAMEMVRDAVNSAEVSQALEKHEISNIATSGLRIITTINRNVQENMLYSLRRDLTRLDVRLRGYEREEVQAELGELDYGGDKKLRKGAFLFGVVEGVAKDPEDMKIEVNLGRRFGQGYIDRSGFARLVRARVRWQKNPWAEEKNKDFSAFLNQFRKGDKIWVSVRERDDQNQLLLDLEKFPKINGGALVLKDGEILAVSGGVENRFFNRAVYGRRTMGSSFKPFVFAAALQLGWNAVDPLRNVRDIFVFQNQPYFPRPDHTSPFEEVSMSWAGVHSENVASVWLLAHLCDRLSREQFREVAAKVDLAPRVVDDEEEPYSRYQARIRDRHGIVLSRDILHQSAFKLAVKNIETDLLFVGRDKEYEILQSMHHGLGFEKFRQQIESELNDNRPKMKKSQVKELTLRLKILEKNYLQIASLFENLKSLRRHVEERLIRFEDPFAVVQQSQSNERLFAGEQGWLYSDNFSNRMVFTADQERIGGMRPVAVADVVSLLSSMSQMERETFWNDIYLDNAISSETMSILSKQKDREFAELEKKLPYSFEVLQHVHDFRIMVGLRYLIALAKESGIESKLEPVLSFPLGSNVVTLLETLRMYEGLTTGEVVLSNGVNGENGNLLSIIDRIETPDGEVIYRPQRLRKRILASENSMVIGHILENVVKYGTGRYADKNIKLTGNSPDGDEDELGSLGLSIPVLGKTGTANRYTNASFFGFLPSMSKAGDSLTMDDGYAIGVYVGYDDNKVMRKGATRISGSAGALPIWSDIAQAIVAEEKYGSQLDPVDLSFYGLGLRRKERGQQNYGVATERGGFIQEGAPVIDSLDRYTPSIITYGRRDVGGAFKPERFFLPYWHVSELQ